MHCYSFVKSSNNNKKIIINLFTRAVVLSQVLLRSTTRSVKLLNETITKISNVSQNLP